MPRRFGGYNRKRVAFVRMVIDPRGLERKCHLMRL